ncbi:MAG: alpha-galactosidase, partial [Clostridia bacterium]|nr:alpha-galactosidase [Clostridia bacterium]
MQIVFSEKNLTAVFEISQDKQLQLLHFSNVPYSGMNDGAKKDYTPVEVQLTGCNQDDHHGVKHTGTYGSKTLKYMSHEYYQNEHGNKLEFTLENGVIRTVLHYQFYTDISAVRAWTVLENISAECAEVEYVTSFSLLGIDSGDKLTSNEKLNVYIPHNSWVREVNWKKYTLSELGFDKITGFSTKRINICNTGTWSAKEYLPMAAVENTETKTHLMWQIENNGSWQWEMSDIAGKMYLKLSGPTENENCWHKSLKPGERFESVKAAVCVGDSFDAALAEMTNYRRKIVRTNICDKNLPVIFNDYMNCLLADPTAEKMIPVIDKAAEAGAEYYCMDAGWYADGTWWDTVGEWQPCGWRFPNGIKATFDYIKSKG